jgi:hypothetical protein
LEKTGETGEIRVEIHDIVLNWLCGEEPIQRNMTVASLQAGKANKQVMQAAW